MEGVRDEPVVLVHEAQSAAETIRIRDSLVATIIAPHVDMAALSALLNRPIVSMTTLIVISLLIVTLGVECRPSVPSPQEEVVEVVAQSDPSIEALHDGLEEDHVRGRQQFGPPPPQQQSILSRMSYSLSGLSDELTGAGSSLMDMMSRFGSSGFGGFGGGGSGYDDYGCPNCGYDFNTFIPAFVLVLASLFFLLATTTAAQSGRRKRSLSDETDDNNQLTGTSHCLFIIEISSILVSKVHIILLAHCKCAYRRHLVLYYLK